MSKKNKEFSTSAEEELMDNFVGNPDSIDINSINGIDRKLSRGNNDELEKSTELPVKPSLFSVHGALGLAQIFYAIFAVLNLTAPTDASPLVFSAIRDVMAAIILFCGLIFRSGKTTVPDGWTFVFIVFLGIIGVALSQVLFLVGLQLSSPHVASSMQPAIPVFTFFLGVVTGTEVLGLHKLEGWVRLIGAILCCLGAFVIALYKGGRLFGSYEFVDLIKASDMNASGVSTSMIDANLKHNLGVCALVGECFCMAFFFVLQKIVMRKYSDAYALTVYTYAVGAFAVSIASILSLPRSAWHLSRHSLIIALYAAIFCSSLNFFILGWANKYVGPGTTALYIPLQPLGTAIIGYVFLNAVLRIGTAIGAFLIFCGLICVASSQNKVISAADRLGSVLPNVRKTPSEVSDRQLKDN